MAEEIVKKFKLKNCIATVHMPVRTPEEQERWQKRIEEATAIFMYQVEKKRAENNQ